MRTAAEDALVVSPNYTITIPHPTGGVLYRDAKLIHYPYWQTGLAYETDARNLLQFMIGRSARELRSLCCWTNQAEKLKERFRCFLGFVDSVAGDALIDNKQYILIFPPLSQLKRNILHVLLGAFQLQMYTDEDSPNIEVNGYTIITPPTTLIFNAAEVEAAVTRTVDWIRNNVLVSRTSPT